MVNTEIKLIIFFELRNGEALIQSAKTRPGADCGSDHELLIAKFRFKLKKVGETTRLFRFGQKYSCFRQHDARPGQGSCTSVLQQEAGGS